VRKHYVLANAALWAAAMLATAALKAPDFLSLVLPPSLATLSLLMVDLHARLNRSDLS